MQPFAVKIGCTSRSKLMGPWGAAAGVSALADLPHDITIPKVKRPLVSKRASTGFIEKALVLRRAETKAGVVRIAKILTAN